VSVMDRPVCLERSSPFMAPAAAAVLARAFTLSIAPMNDPYSAALRARTRAGRAVYVCCAFRYGEHAVSCHEGTLGFIVTAGERVYRDRPVYVECPSPFKASAAARASTFGVAPMNNLYSATLRACARTDRAVYVRRAFRYGELAVDCCVDTFGIMVVARNRVMFVKSVVLGLNQDSAVAILIIGV
jgi:hypothetical protein